jgi:hypothetical protein
VDLAADGVDAPAQLRIARRRDGGGQPGDVAAGAHVVVAGDGGDGAIDVDAVVLPDREQRPQTLARAIEAAHAQIEDGLRLLAALVGGGAGVGAAPPTRRRGGRRRRGSDALRTPRRRGRVRWRRKAARTRSRAGASHRPATRRAAATRLQSTAGDADASQTPPMASAGTSAPAATPHHRRRAGVRSRTSRRSAIEAKRVVGSDARPRRSARTSQPGAPRGSAGGTSPASASQKVRQNAY